MLLGLKAPDHGRSLKLDMLETQASRVVGRAERALAERQRVAGTIRNTVHGVHGQ